MDHEHDHRSPSKVEDDVATQVVQSEPSQTKHASVLLRVLGEESLLSAYKGEIDNKKSLIFIGKLELLVPFSGDGHSFMIGRKLFDDVRVSSCIMLREFLSYPIT